MVLEVAIVVIPDSAPAVETSKADESMENVPAPEKAIVPVEANPVAPDMAPAPLMSKEAESKMNDAGAVPSITIAEVKVPAVFVI